MKLSHRIAANDLAALLLRISLATMWLTHSIVLKILTFGMDGLAQWMDSIGLPGALAYPLVVAEIVGGILILLGAGGRWASLALLPVLFGATWVHAGNGWVFSHQWRLGIPGVPNRRLAGARIVR